MSYRNTKPGAINCGAVLKDNETVSKQKRDAVDRTWALQQSRKRMLVSH